MPHIHVIPLNVECPPGSLMSLCVSCIVHHADKHTSLRYTALQDALRLLPTTSKHAPTFTILRGSCGPAIDSPDGLANPYYNPELSNEQLLDRGCAPGVLRCKPRPLSRTTPYLSRARHWQARNSLTLPGNTHRSYDCDKRRLFARCCATGSPWRGMGNFSGTPPRQASTGRATESM